MQMLSLREKLKVYTQGFHNQLEKSVVGKQLAQGTVSKENYLSYLQSLYTIHRTIETVADQFLQFYTLGLDLSLHKRAPLLHKDITLLGGECPMFLSSFFEDKFSLPLSFEKLVGMLYVLEGSTMGGQYLAKSLAHIKDTNGISCTHYFQSYGLQTQRRWGEYCDFLSRFETHFGEKNLEVILGASALYLLLLEIMNA